MEEKREYLDDIKKPGFLKKISLWWSFKVRYLHLDIINGVKNIIYFRKLKILNIQPGKVSLFGINLITI